MTATTPKARIQKGKDLENHICQQIATKGLDLRARRSYGSGNSNGCKADIDTTLTILGLPAGIESKHLDRIDINGCWRQTCKLVKLGYEPILVFKQTADQYGDTKVIMFLDTLLELLKENQELKNKLN